MKTNIRYVRQMKKMTLQELSEKSGITVAYLSMIERDQRDPTLSTLFKIASALDVRTESLWTDISSEEKILESVENGYGLIRKEERTGYKRLYPGVDYESVTANPFVGGKNIGLLGHIGRLLPGADTNPEGMAWHDEEELIFMLKGNIQCCLEKESITLQEGDCILLKKHTIHKFVNTNEEEAEFMMVRYVQ